MHFMHWPPDTNYIDQKLRFGKRDGLATGCGISCNARPALRNGSGLCDPYRSNGNSTPAPCPPFLTSRQRKLVSVKRLFGLFPFHAKTFIVPFWSQAAALRSRRCASHHGVPSRSLFKRSALISVASPTHPLYQSLSRPNNRHLAAVSGRAGGATPIAECRSVTVNDSFPYLDALLRRDELKVSEEARNRCASDKQECVCFLSVQTTPPKKLNKRSRLKFPDGFLVEFKV